MAKLPSVKTISEGDFRDQPWAKKLLDPLNSFMAAVGNALNNGLSVQDNLAAQVDTRSFYVSDTAATNPYPFGFTWRFPQVKPQGCLIVRADSDDSVESITTGLMPRWEYNAGRIVILGVRGSLTLNKRYSMTFYTFG